MGLGLFKEKPIPGVVYSENWTPPSENDFKAWKGALYHVKADKLPQGISQVMDQETETGRPGPEGLRRGGRARQQQHRLRR